LILRLGLDHFGFHQSSSALMWSARPAFNGKQMFPFWEDHCPG
jgi:hypothetical protein